MKAPEEASSSTDNFFNFLGYSFGHLGFGSGCGSANSFVSGSILDPDPKYCRFLCRFLRIWLMQNVV